MDIIVLGNGYDLAHGLPTRYVDFLNFINIIINMSDNCLISEINQYIIDGINNCSKNPEDKILKEIKELIKDNFWIKYFNKKNEENEENEEKMKEKENWIDFENEISNVIQSIDKMIKNQHDASIYSNIKDIQSFEDIIFAGETSISSSEYKAYKRSGYNTYADFRDKILKDLNNFIRCFEIYLAVFVENISIDSRFDILKIPYDYKHLGVISFNYTHTFQKFNQEVVANFNDIKETLQIDYHYIHGEAKINNTVENNNMVLGIGEYLEGEAKNKETDFIAFKKYYQRILKQTGSKYKSWLQGISINNYIIGHSLDVTDKDILKDLILQDISSSSTTIYYYNKNDLEKKITNLVKVIGQEELIKRTGENNIIFKNQEEIYIKQ